MACLEEGYINSFICSHNTYFLTSHGVSGIVLGMQPSGEDRVEVVPHRRQTCLQWFH